MEKAKLEKFPTCLKTKCFSFFHFIDTTQR